MDELPDLVGVRREVRPRGPEADLVVLDRPDPPEHLAAGLYIARRVAEEAEQHVEVGPLEAHPGRTRRGVNQHVEFAPVRVDVGKVPGLFARGGFAAVQEDPFRRKLPAQRFVEGAGLRQAVGGDDDLLLGPERLVQPLEPHLLVRHERVRVVGRPRERVPVELEGRPRPHAFEGAVRPVAEVRIHADDVPGRPEHPREHRERRGKVPVEAAPELFEDRLDLVEDEQIDRFGAAGHFYPVERLDLDDQAGVPVQLDVPRDVRVQLE